MKVFLAIAFTIGGVVLLVGELLKSSSLDVIYFDGTELFCGVVLLAAGITWLWKLGVFARFRERT